jgi:hypothetical protein
MKGVASHVIYYESCPPCACTNDYFPAAALKRSYNPEWIAFSWNGSYFLGMAHKFVEWLIFS